MQNLPHVYIFEHLELDVKPTPTHYGKLASDVADDVFSGPFLSPHPKRLRHSVSSSALLERNYSSAASAQIARPHIRPEDVARAEMCLDWLVAFERDEYWSYQHQSAGIIESGFSSAAPACFMQTSTHALVLEVTYAREYLRRECQIRRALPKAQHLRADWDAQRWLIQEAAGQLQRKIDEYVRQETAWVRKGQAQHRTLRHEKVDEKAVDSDELRESSLLPDRAALLKTTQAADITLSVIRHDCRLLRHLLDEAWADLQELLGAVKPCHGLRLVPPDDEEPEDTKWRKRHRDRQCKERKPPVMVWRIMQGLERQVVELTEEVEALQRASHGWSR